MREPNYYDEGNGRLSQFVKNQSNYGSDSEIVERHLGMIQQANQEKIAREKSLVPLYNSAHGEDPYNTPKKIPLFGPDREFIQKESGKFTLNKIDSLLLGILSHRRPHASQTEEKFIEHYIDSIDDMKVDGYGNRYIRIGDAPVLWSCHTDSVHTDIGYQKIHVEDDWVYLAKKERKANRGYRNCLGADDGAGIYLCLKMIEREIPGLYVFHRGEEVGGLGSSWAASNADMDFFKGITMAIALDRKGYDSVITFQGRRCCSNVFAQALADQLGGSFKPDSTGLFTDTANYTGIIPECTNLSVGYFRQHGPSEVQNYKFLDALLEQLCALRIHELPIERNISDLDYDYGKNYGYSYGGNYTYGYGGNYNYDYGRIGVDRSTYRSKFDSENYGDGDNDNFDYNPETKIYTPKKRIHEYGVDVSGGSDAVYNGEEYDPWDDDDNNPDNWETAERIEADVSEAWVEAIARDTAHEDDTTNKKPNHRFTMFKTAAQHFPAMIADLLAEQNVTLQEFVELDPWAAAAILAQTDIDEEHLAACIDDEIYNNGYPDDYYEEDE